MDEMSKAFGAISDVASTAWGYAKNLSTPSSSDQSKLAHLQSSSFTPSEDTLNGMFDGMIKSGEAVLEKWMKFDGEDVEVFEQFSLLASQLISNTSFGKINCSEANNTFPDIGWIVKMNDDIESKKLGQTNIMGEQFKQDLVGKLIAANQESEKEKSISIEDTADERKAFCFVGRVATASLLGWAIHMLARDKGLQERARKEVIEMFGCENPNLDGISKLKSMNMIVEECERRYPLVPSIKTKVAKGVVEEQSLDKAKRNVNLISIHYGPGTCLGLNFAKIEAKVVLSMILRCFAFTLSPAYVHSPVHDFTVSPKHGIRVVLRKLGAEEDKMTKIVKTVGVVAIAAVVGWGMTRLGGFGPEEPDQGKNKKMMKNPGRHWEKIGKDEFNKNPKDQFSMNRARNKAEKAANRALGIK